MNRLNQHLQNRFRYYERFIIVRVKGQERHRIDVSYCDCRFRESICGVCHDKANRAREGIALSDAKRLAIAQ